MGRTAAAALVRAGIPRVFRWPAHDSGAWTNKDVAADWTSARYCSYWLNASSMIWRRCRPRMS